MVVAVLGTRGIAIEATGADEGPVAHWNLSEDARDSGPKSKVLSGNARSVAFGADERGAKKAARFDGRESVIAVPAAPDLDFGTGDFSVCAWINTAAELDDVIGDVLSKYDHATRAGFHLGIVNNAGVPSSQANHRTLQFGIGRRPSGGSDAQTEPKWMDHGRPGNAVLIYSMAVFDGDLYVGTCEAGREESGHVFLFAGGDQWIDCGSPAPCNAVSALAVFDGKLYAGVSHYRLRGSALTDSENETFGGRIFRYDGRQNWVDTGALAEPNPEAINGMVVYRGQLYASLTYAPGLYRYDGKSWTSCGSPDGKRVEALAVHDGFLYATGYDEGAVYRYDGSEWVHLGRLAENTQTYSFAVFRGDMYVGTWPSGRVYRYGGEKSWIDTGRLGEELEVMGAAVYNGDLYAGTLPLADVYRYDGDDRWMKVGRVDFTPDVKYRRAWTMAVYNGRLFAGTLPSGRVWSMESGKCATYDRALEAGWHHVAAIRSGDRLKLFVDGELKAHSSQFDPRDFDVSNNSPLTIGFGPHDHFNGSLSDVRLYRRALAADEIRALHNAK